MFYKTSTQKEKAQEFYNSYKGNKVSRPTFYYRVRLGGEETREDKIKIRAKNQYRRRDKTPKGRRAEQMIWYNEQPEPRASKTLFKNRLNSGYEKEKAILLGDARQAARRGPSNQSYSAKVYVPKKPEIKQPKESDFLIEITYPKEVAKVFREEYQKMIDDTERELTYVSEKTEVAELNNKLDRLHKEIEVFNQYNS